jgi:hypothetical protein
MSCGSNECTGYAVAVEMTGLSYGRPVLVLRMSGECCGLWGGGVV